jgi:hypothetical protein
MLPIKTSSVGISSPVDCADEREAMPVNGDLVSQVTPNCRGAWSSPASSYSYAYRTLLYTQAQWVFQICRAETRGLTPNARKHNDIVAAIIRDGQLSEETDLCCQE